ncbi:hypothetical protein [Nostoc sp.]
MNSAKSSTNNVNTQKQLLEKTEAKSTLGQRVVYLPFNFEKAKEDNS